MAGAGWKRCDWEKWYELMKKEDAKDKFDVVNLIHMKQTKPVKYSKRVNPVLRSIIDGLLDTNSWLHLLIGLPHIVRQVWGHVLDHWESCIVDGQVHMSEFDNYKTLALQQFSHTGTGIRNSEIKFPPPQDLNINMMPFVLERTFEKTKLPEYLRPYWDNIINTQYHASHRYRGCSLKLISDSEVGRVGYLTVHESFVPAKETQRRGGIHTDCPGKLMIVENEKGEYICLGKVDKEGESGIKVALDNKFGVGYCEDKVGNVHHPWGFGMVSQQCDFIGGIFMASNLANSTQAWNMRVVSTEDGDEVIGAMGNLENLRHILPGKPEMLRPNMVYWMTDRTPHEALPVTEPEGVYRQYFRLVTGDVSLWFEEHSTKNPNGVVPDPNLTKTIKYSKFEDNLPRLLDETLELPEEEDEPTALDSFRKYWYSVS